MNEYTNLEYWVSVQGEIDVSLPDDNIIKKWIIQNIDFSGLNTCLEIGCYPGKFLTIFANKEVQVHGIDINPKTTEIKSHLDRLGFNTGEFLVMDFTKETPTRKYDCICSFGFIEHFTNWEEIIEKHIGLLSPGGTLIIEIPNFKGIFQRLPRQIFDNNNFKRHNLATMDLGKLVNQVERNGMTVKFAGYIGGYQLWFEHLFTNLFIRAIKKIFCHLLKIIVKFFGLEHTKHAGSAIGIIACKL
jgi:L-malate glycosyltransferase